MRLLLLACLLAVPIGAAATEAPDRADQTDVLHSPTAPDVPAVEATEAPDPAVASNPALPDAPRTIGDGFCQETQARVRAADTAGLEDGGRIALPDGGWISMKLIDGGRDHAPAPDPCSPGDSHQTGSPDQPCPSTDTEPEAVSHVPALDQTLPPDPDVSTKQHPPRMRC